MSGYLIDTNVVSELRKRDRANAGAIRWFADHATDELWVSVLVLGELRRGAGLLSRRDAASGAALGRWVDDVADHYRDRVLPVSLAVCERWAELSVPDPVPVVDGLLAATAIVHDLTLVTRNVSDVARSGVACINPFDEA